MRILSVYLFKETFICDINDSTSHLTSARILLVFHAPTEVSLLEFGLRGYKQTFGHGLSFRCYA